MSKLETVNTDALQDEQMYTCRLEFRSLGSASQVSPNIEYSHRFPDDYEGELPSAYLCMRDVCMMLSQYLTVIPNTEFDEIPEDPDEAAALAFAAAQKANLPEGGLQ